MPAAELLGQLPPLHPPTLFALCQQDKALPATLRAPGPSNSSFSMY